MNNKQQQQFKEAEETQDLCGDDDGTLLKMGLSHNLPPKLLLWQRSKGNNLLSRRRKIIYDLIFSGKKNLNIFRRSPAAPQRQ